MIKRTNNLLKADEIYNDKSFKWLIVNRYLLLMCISGKLAASDGHIIHINYSNNSRKIMNIFASERRSTAISPRRNAIILCTPGYPFR